MSEDFFSFLPFILFYNLSLLLYTVIIINKFKVPANKFYENFLIYAVKIKLIKWVGANDPSVFALARGRTFSHNVMQTARNSRKHFCNIHKLLFKNCQSNQFINFTVQ